MKQFRVNEYGKDIWIQTYGSTIKQWCSDSKSSEDYTRYSDYFNKLLGVIGNIIEDVDLALNITSEATDMTLYLKDDQLPMAESIKSALLESFPDDIESVGIVGNELNIMDIFFEYHG